MLKKITMIIGIFALGAISGTYFDQIHTIEEKIVYKDRTRTIVKEVITERPDGTKVTERVTDKNEKKDTKLSKKESIPSQKNWGVGVKYDVFSPVPVWTLEVDRRIIGNIYAGAYGRTDGIIGVGVRILF